MRFNHPLMHNNFTRADMNAAIKLLKAKNNILTQSKNVDLFEKRWSKWLGVKYSIFVNSGSSANLLTLAILILLILFRISVALAGSIACINALLRNSTPPRANPHPPDSTIS